MNVISLKVIKDFGKKYADSRDALLSWYHEAENADWQNPQIIKNRYPTASFMENDMVIFNIKGNKYRLVVKVSYRYKTVYIKWIGTHAEYDKRDFKGGK
ncbi:MAG: type II toxin-antitoxin system HigB family toxin [Acidobacteria bacterium]|nr:type II toxin-antitoxin system HigB family toxin [Acidobacteriota bacterium]